MNEFIKKWEDWYGDLLTEHQWHELEYKDTGILYVYGSTGYTGDEGALSASFIQVIGPVDSELSLNEEDQEEIIALLKTRHGIDNICFWIV